MEERPRASLCFDLLSFVGIVVLQLSDCPGAGEATLKDMDGWIAWTY